MLHLHISALKIPYILSQICPQRQHAIHMLILTSKWPHFEFIHVTMPGLEPPLAKSGYRPENVLHIVSKSIQLLLLLSLCWFLGVKGNAGDPGDRGPRGFVGKINIVTSQLDTQFMLRIAMSLGPKLCNMEHPCIHSYIQLCIRFRFPGFRCRKPYIPCQSLLLSTIVLVDVIIIIIVLQQ